MRCNALLALGLVTCLCSIFKSNCNVGGCCTTGLNRPADGDSRVYGHLGFLPVFETMEQQVQPEVRAKPSVNGLLLWVWIYAAHLTVGFRDAKYNLRPWQPSFYARFGFMPRNAQAVAPHVVSEVFHPDFGFGSNRPMVHPKVPPMSLAFAPKVCSTRTRAADLVQLLFRTCSVTGLPRLPFRWMQLLSFCACNLASISADREAESAHTPEPVMPRIDR